MTTGPVRIAILTISDSGARGLREDVSGAAIADWAEGEGHAVTRRAMVPDDSVAIVRALCTWCDADAADVVLTTGGTGLGPRDVTPEATRSVMEREAPGLAEHLRMAAMAREPRAALSRGVAGVRARTLLVNLPGSPSGVRDGLALLSPVLRHAIAVLRDQPSGH